MIEVTLKFESIEALIQHFTPNLQGAQPAVASNTGSPSSPPPSPAPVAASNTVSDGTQSAAAPAVSAPDKRKPGRPPKPAPVAATNPAPAPAVSTSAPSAPSSATVPEAGTSPTIARVQEVAQKALERVKARVALTEPNPKAANIMVMAELRETLQQATGVERINLLTTPEDMQKAIDALEALK